MTADTRVVWVVDGNEGSFVLLSDGTVWLARNAVDDWELMGCLEGFEDE